MQSSLMRRRMGQRAAYESLMRKKNMIMNTAALEDSGDEETPGWVYRRMGQSVAYESLMRKKNMILNTADIEDSGDSWVSI